MPANRRGLPLFIGACSARASGMLRASAFLPRLAALLMNTYACLPRQHVEHHGHALLPVQPAHIEPIRQWRNAQMDVLRQSAPISADQQQDYFARHIWPTQSLAQPANLLLGLLHEGRLIGYGGLVHIAWQHRRAELSFLLDPQLSRNEARYAADFSAFIGLVAELAFDDLRFRRLFTETYAMRRHHIAVLEANRFQAEGVLRQHVLIDGAAVDSLLHGRLSPYLPDTRPDTRPDPTS